MSYWSLAELGLDLGLGAENRARVDDQLRQIEKPRVRIPPRVLLDAQPCAFCQRPMGEHLKPAYDCPEVWDLH